MFRLFLLSVLVALVVAEPCVQAAVELGIDRLEQQNFVTLAGKRVGLITNQTGVNSRGIRTRQILRKAGNVNLVALFTPEHGLDGTELAGKHVPSRRDPLTGLIAHSLYGPTRKPTPEMLRGIEMLVFDMQDIGVRSYTYISTMARCMEAAGEAGIEFVVLDRPNPLGGLRVEGPLIEPGLISFVGQVPTPYVHGLTAGEMARMINGQGWMAARCRLSVIEMRGWNRRMVWQDTGLHWVQTSPNIPRADSPGYYVATGIIGSLAGMEIGVGGPQPFEICAAKWLDANAFTSYLRRLDMPGVSFSPYHAEGFEGARIQIDAHATANLTALAVYLLAESNRVAKPNMFARSPAEKLDIFYKVYGSRSIRAALDAGTPVPRIVDSWRPNISRFEAARGPYLIY